MWIDALVARHTASLTRPEFLKALRALSARYVESRGRLPARSPIDSAGKRAAFAAFYAPLHFLTTREIARALGAGGTGGGGSASTDGPATIIDLGCGTGVASAAWALEYPGPRPSIRGVDLHPWVLPEAQWNWRQLEITGSARRADLVRVAEDLVQPPGRTTILLGWSVNELESASRARLLAALTRLAAAGVRVVVIEPIARSASPWWAEWVAAFGDVEGNDWKFDVPLPPVLAEINDAAGFSERELSARTIVSRP